jgi:hypothetical protein
MIIMSAVNIRLACERCDGDHEHFITPEQLGQCKAEGWADINEVRSSTERRGPVTIMPTIRTVSAS